VPELVFAIVLVWAAADTGVGEVTTWIGWIPGSPGRLVSGLGVRYQPMSFKRRVLSALGKAVLLEIGRDLELDVTTPMGVEELRDALAKSKRAKLDAIVQESLSRDTLKNIRGAVGLDDTCKEKAALVERILMAGGDKAANGAGYRIDPAAVRGIKAAEDGGALGALLSGLDAVPAKKPTKAKGKTKQGERRRRGVPESEAVIAGTLKAALQQFALGAAGDYSGARVGKAREAALDYIVANGGTITNAVSSREWPGEAALNVSMVNWTKAPADGPFQLVVDEQVFPVAQIPTHLRLDVDVSGTKPLQTNDGGTSRGVIFGNGAFVLAAADPLLATIRGRPIVRPVANGTDMHLDPKDPRWFSTDCIEPPPVGS
jgi:hypothetical protein